MRVVSLLLSLTFMFAQGDLKINSDSYFDYFYNTGNDKALSDFDGFGIRRIYVTFNKKLNDQMSTRIRFEVAGSHLETTNDKHYPFVKDFYFKYNINESSSVTAGLQGSLLLKSMEKFYGLRYIEKTPNDLYSYHSSREIGLSYSSILSDNLTFSMMLSNGEGDKSENNRGEMISTAITYNSDQLILEASGSHNSEINAMTSANVIQLIGGFETDEFQIMASAHLRENQDKSTEAIEQMKVISLFSSIRINDSKLFGRVDFNFSGISKSPSYYTMTANEEFTFAIFGYEMKPEDFLYITPNVAIVSYKDGSFDNDIIARITMRLKW